MSDHAAAAEDLEAAIATDDAAAVVAGVIRAHACDFNVVSPTPGENTPSAEKHFLFSARSQLGSGDVTHARLTPQEHAGCGKARVVEISDGPGRLSSRDETTTAARIWR